MPRQNFISKDFFVNASEKEIKETLLAIPQFINSIRLVGERTISPAVKFVYEEAANQQSLVYVSLLPLNEEQTRVAIYVSYANGQVFHKDSYISNTLTNFESVIHAAMRGDLQGFEPRKPERSFSKKVVQFMANCFASMGILFLKKKLA